MDSEHHPKLSPLRAFQALHSQSDAEENLRSLSGYHDYEPCLEFDDSELMQAGGLAPLPPELLDVSDEYFSTIDENFEESIGEAPAVYKEISDSLDADHYDDLRSTGLVEVVGDDDQGRQVVIISACKLPPNKEVDDDRVLQYILFTLDRFVEQDYTVVYFHHGLASSKFSVGWLWKAYKALDRKYKKNIKALYLVHPTYWMRVVWQMLRPMFSVKFGRKMMYVNYLHELAQHVPLNRLIIPADVLIYDRKISTGSTRAFTSACDAGVGKEKYKNMPAITTQFKVSLQFIWEYNVGVVDCVPPVVRSCVEFLSQPDAIETEGLFRRSVNQALIKEIIKKCNDGEQPDFQGDPHYAAVLLKAFLRFLDEPIMTFELYDEITSFPTWLPHERLRRAKIIMLERLPTENYLLLKYIFKFLWQVQDRSCLNKMTINNLAIVFGPNIAWGLNDRPSLHSICPVNSFTDFILANQETVFAY